MCRVIPLPMKPVSGFVSKCVRDFDICLHKAFKREQSVGVTLDFRGNKVPLTWDNSKSGIKGSKKNSALILIGLHNVTKNLQKKKKKKKINCCFIKINHLRLLTPNRNMAFQVQDQVL